MALSIFGIFTDAGLTSALVGNTLFSHNNDGSTGNIDKILYIGSNTGGAVLETEVNPGVDQINLSITDSNASAGTPKVADLKLALTLLGLDTAVAGAALDVGTTVDGGVVNALPIYIRGSKADGSGTDLQIVTNALVEA